MVSTIAPCAADCYLCSGCTVDALSNLAGIGGIAQCSPALGGHFHVYPMHVGKYIQSFWVRVPSCLWTYVGSLFAAQWWSHSAPAHEDASSASQVVSSTVKMFHVYLGVRSGDCSDSVLHFRCYKRVCAVMLLQKAGSTRQFVCLGQNAHCSGTVIYSCNFVRVCNVWRTSFWGIAIMHQKAPKNQSVLCASCA